MKTNGNRLQRRNSKRITAWAVIGLLVFGVVAVNGGLILAQRQVAQNAADAASLSGALALTQGYGLDQIEGIVMQRAKDQGFDPEDPNTAVEVSWVSDIVGAGASFSNNLQVEITSEYTSLFTAIFNSSKSSMTVGALAHARMHEDLAPGFAVVSLSDTDCQESATGGDGCQQRVDPLGGANFIPVTGGTQVSLTEVPLPDCSGLLDYGEVEITKSATLQPGKYSSITIGERASLNLNPGLYCIYGSGAEGHSFLMADMSQVIGQDVILHLMEGAGSFKVSPTSGVYLYAPKDLLDPSGRQWGGMLIYAHPDVQRDFTFTGTSNSAYRGTIYAPGARCEVQGTKGFVTLKSQIVCDTVDFSEVDGLYISYDMSTNYHLPEAVQIMD